MILAIVIVHVGRIFARRADNDRRRYLEHGRPLLPRLLAAVGG